MEEFDHIFAALGFVRNRFYHQDAASLLREFVRSSFCQQAASQLAIAEFAIDALPAVSGSRVFSC